MKIVVSNQFKNTETKILNFLNNFDSEGELFGDGNRNQIKIFKLDDKEINIKSFQIPNPVNKFVYRFFRKSKAERSFEYAQFLISKKIGTPQPIAYAEETSAFSFKRSFYISEHLAADLTFRKLVQEPDYPDRERILRAFTRFTFELHEKNIEFLDHSPGNTLIKLNNGNYHFFLVDLNRMNFRNLDFDARMKNFSRLTPKKEMIAIMASEYAGLIRKSETEVFKKMWFFTDSFFVNRSKNQKLKQKFKSLTGLK